MDAAIDNASSSSSMEIAELLLNATTTQYPLEAALVSTAITNNGPQSVTGLTVLLDQLQRSASTAAAAAASGSAEVGQVAEAAGRERLPHNLTLIFNELQRFSFRSEESLQPYRTHGMTDEEYSRFVSDMWIGIVLTLLMVLIVVALCMWFLYHKFQQWKQQYNEDHSQHTLTHVVSTGALNIDSAGTGNAPDEMLPQYTLVSGLPTYDDALEQIRHTNSTNHLLINHQTLMKLFGSAPATIGSMASGSAKDNQDTITSNSTQFCVNCQSDTASQSADNPNNQSKQPEPQPQQFYLARIESCQLEQLVGHGHGQPPSESRRSSMCNLPSSSVYASATNLSTTHNSPSASRSSCQTQSSGSTTVITTGSGHRFTVCSALSPALIHRSRRRASDCPTPAVGGFRRLLSLNPDAASRMPPPIPAAMRRRGLLDVPSCSLGNLSARRERSASLTPNRWSLGQPLQQQQLQQQQERLEVAAAAAAGGGGGGGGGGGSAGSCGNVEALFRHRASLY